VLARAQLVMLLQNLRPACDPPGSRTAQPHGATRHARIRNLLGIETVPPTAAEHAPADNAVPVQAQDSVMQSSSAFHCWSRPAVPGTGARLAQAHGVDLRKAPAPARLLLQPHVLRGRARRSARLRHRGRRVRLRAQAPDLPRHTLERSSMLSKRTLRLWHQCRMPTFQQPGLCRLQQVHAHFSSAFQQHSAGCNNRKGSFPPGNQRGRPRAEQAWKLLVSHPLCRTP